MNEKDPYISLKEAAQISGYSPDYIGQLIRKGKLPGKQVFSNVAWVTTEEALRSYLAKDSGASRTDGGSWMDAILSVETVSRVYIVLAWAAIGILTVFVLFLVYVGVVAIEQSVERQAGSEVELSL